MLNISILNSGNGGNCYVVTTTNPQFSDKPKSIMVDCGGTYIPQKILEDVGCICITHTHRDHVSLLPLVMRELDYKPLIVMNKQEYYSHNFRYTLHQMTNNHIKWVFPILRDMRSEPILVGNFVIIACKAHHDTPMPTHYFISDGDKTVFIGCDSAIIDINTLDLMSEADAVLIEANYSERVMKHNYKDGEPLNIVFSKNLKNRIANMGHLSNQQVKEIIPMLSKTKVICLTHINEILNSKETIIDEIGKRKDKKIVICTEKDCPIFVKV